MQRKRTRSGVYGTRPPKITPIVRDGKPTGALRVQCFDPSAQTWVSALKVLGMPRRTIRTRTEAKEIARLADEKLSTRRSGGDLTVVELSERWIAFKVRNADGQQWSKDSSRIVNEARIAPFLDAYGEDPIDSIDEDHWHDLGGPLCNLGAVKSMFAWAASSDGGRLIERNPFMDLKAFKGKGNREKNPPSEAEIDALITHAYTLWPGYGAWLEFACFTGMRPGEIDALRWTDVMHVPARNGEDPYIRVLVRRSLSRTSGAVTLPKSNVERELQIPVDGRAAHAIGRARQHSAKRPHVFVNQEGGHFTGDSRLHYWATAYERMSWVKGQYTPYLCTRHFAGWFMVNRLEQESEIVADMLGHSDDGELVRALYGHREKQRSLRRVREAYASYSA